MTYRHHTHKLIVKNANELLKNYELCLSKNSCQIESYKKNPEVNNGKNTILVAGFLNLHAHLAFSKLQLKPQNLFPWLKDLMINSKKIDHMVDSKLGAQKALASGSTFIIDNTSSLEASYQAIQSTGLKAIIGLEIFGSDPQKTDEIFTKAIHELDKFEETDDIQLTLSPHACYDVSVSLWKKALAWGKKNNKLILTHLAESQAEEKWFKEKDSEASKEAVEFWSWLNTLETKLEHWQSYDGSCDFLIKNDLVSANLLLTHLCYAPLEHMQELKKSKVKFVSCPRSNKFLGNQVPEHQIWNNENFDFGLGTDSLASNYDLDMRKEAHTIKNLSARTKYQLITEKAAKLINKNHELGSLDEGKSADFVVLELRKMDLDLDSCDPFKIIMDTDICSVKEVYINGRICYQDETRN